MNADVDVDVDVDVNVVVAVAVAVVVAVVKYTWMTIFEAPQNMISPRRSRDRYVDLIFSV